MKGTTMMIKMLLGLLVPLVLLCSCDLFGSDDDDSGSKIVSLGAQTSANETGTATLLDLGSSKTQIAITTSGGTDTGVQSVAIYSGTCSSGGTIYAVLNNLQASQSITTISTSLSSLTGGDYHIAVHSSTDVNTTVACGNL
jgi:hypothetical protein